MFSVTRGPRRTCGVAAISGLTSDARRLAGYSSSAAFRLELYELSEKPEDCQGLVETVWLPVPLGKARKPGRVLFNTGKGAKEPRNPQNHRSVVAPLIIKLLVQFLAGREVYIAGTPRA